MDEGEGVKTTGFRLLNMLISANRHETTCIHDVTDMMHLI